ncbi:trypsin-like serine protease [uncultured Shewanella sp.]|uniref:trypsin-like serine protease n=1 Tax=uncultured Shewanella sp. TaxID=173975 RepID=UPI002639B3E5|nr:trypsin-like serine protease [uncultured Shewanella sp.]
MKNKLAVLVGSTLALSLSSTAVAEVSGFIGGNGTNNPIVDKSEFNNIVKLYTERREHCTGTVVGGDWVLSTYHCKDYGDLDSYFSENWVSQWEGNKPYSETHYMQAANMVPHPEQGTDYRAETMLMRLNTTPHVSYFSAINPTELVEIQWEDFCLRTGLDFYWDGSMCRYARNPETGEYEPFEMTGNFGQELMIYGYATTTDLRTGRIEVTNDWGNPLPSTEASFMGAFADGWLRFDEDGIETQGGDSGSPYLDENGYIAAVHYGKDKTGTGTTADMISFGAEWILNTVDGWHYPTQATTDNNVVSITFQSLHKNSIDLLNNLSVDGLELDESTISCKKPTGETSTLQVQPWDICTLTVTNHNESEGKVYLSSDAVITVDKGREDTPETPEDSNSGGSMHFSVLLLSFVALLRRKYAK